MKTFAVMVGSAALVMAGSVALAGAGERVIQINGVEGQYSIAIPEGSPANQAAAPSGPNALTGRESNAGAAAGAANSSGGTVESPAPVPQAARPSHQGTNGNY